MKKTLIIQSLILGLMTILSCKAQTDTEFFSNKICEVMSDIDTELPKMELMNLLQTRTQFIYLEYPKKVQRLQTESRYKFKDKTNQEIAMLFGTSISFKAMENCPKFREVAQIAFTPEPKKYTKSMKIVSEQLCELLENSGKKNYSDLKKIIDAETYDIIQRNKELIEKEYDNVNIPTYNDDLIPILMKTCEQYFMVAMNEQLN